MQRQGKFLIGTAAEVGAWLMQMPISRRITSVQNHHTFLPNYSQFSGNHFARLFSMDEDHIQNREWSEIGQHFTVFPDGVIGICRTLEKNPAGIYLNNTGAVCIEAVGNFDVGKDIMTRMQKLAIVQLNAILCKKFALPIDTNTLVYHHWFDLNSGERLNGTGTTKSCPGSNFFGGNKVEDAQKFFIPLVLNAFLQNNLEINVLELFYGKVLPPKLNVRKSPNKDGALLKIIDKDAKIAIFEIKDGWYRINALSDEWVNGKFIQQMV